MRSRSREALSLCTAYILSCSLWNFPCDVSRNLVSDLPDPFVAYKVVDRDRRVLHHQRAVCCFQRKIAEKTTVGIRVGLALVVRQPTRLSIYLSIYLCAQSTSLTRIGVSDIHGDVISAGGEDLVPVDAQVLGVRVDVDVDQVGNLQGRREQSSCEEEGNPKKKRGPGGGEAVTFTWSGAWLTGKSSAEIPYAVR